MHAKQTKKPYCWTAFKKSFLKNVLKKTVKEENRKDLIEKNSERIRKNMLETKRNPPGLAICGSEYDGKKGSRMTLRVSNLDDLSIPVPPTKSENEGTGAGVGGRTCSQVQHL